MSCSYIKSSRHPSFLKQFWVALQIISFPVKRVCCCYINFCRYRHKKKVYDFQFSRKTLGTLKTFLQCTTVTVKMLLCLKYFFFYFWLQIIKKYLNDDHRKSRISGSGSFNTILQNGLIFITKFNKNIYLIDILCHVNLYFKTKYIHRMLFSL